MDVGRAFQHLKSLHEMLFYPFLPRSAKGLSLTVVIYGPKKVAGSSQEAKGFISHSCFPFL